MRLEIYIKSQNGRRFKKKMYLKEWSSNRNSWFINVFRGFVHTNFVRIFTVDAESQTVLRY